MFPFHNLARHGGPAALRIVLIYAGFSALWILFSDQAVYLMFSDRTQIARASMFKGWFFVAVTSVLLYLLVCRMQARLRQASQRESAMQAEKLGALRLLETIAESSDDAIFAKDIEGRYVLFNRAASVIVGKPVDAVLGRDDHAIFPPEQAEMLLERGRVVVAQDRVCTEEEWLSTAEGEGIFLVTKGPLRNVDGQVTGHFGIARDITARKHAEAGLQQLAEDLAATIQAIPDLLFELDEQGRYIKAETSAAGLLAAPAGQLLGRGVREVLPPAAAQVVMDALAAAKCAGSDYGRTITLPLADGARHFELSLARKATRSGHLQHFVMLSRDITARRAAEDELRRNYRELQRFEANSVGREMRMIELKRQVNELSQELGRAAPFDLAFTRPATAGKAHVPA